MKREADTSIVVDTRTLLRLAIPSTIFTVLTHAYRSVDQFWIKDVSVEAQAAIGATVFVLIVFAGVFEMIGAGVSPWIARATGAGDPLERKKALGAGIFGCCLVFLVVALAGSLGAPTIVKWIGLSGKTATEAQRYLTTISLSSLPLALTPLVDLSFTAMGRAKLPMKLHALSLGLNLLLTPLLIHQADLGIVGAALASNISRGVATLIGLIALIKQTGMTQKQVRGGEALKKIFRIGAPVGAGTIAYALSYWVMLTTSISPLGPHINAALGVGFSALEGFTWPCFHGLSLAVASFVGRALGSGQPDQARKAMWLGLPLVGILGLGATLLFRYGGYFLTGIFSANEQVHLAATQYTLILAFSQIFVAFESLYEGVLNGAGATKTVFWLNLPMNAARVVLAWYFAFPLGYGAIGVWWAINITTIAKAVLKGWVSHRGNWVSVRL
jgi:MATE family multidrug resistance protein